MAKSPRIISPPDAPQSSPDPEPAAILSEPEAEPVLPDFVIMTAPYAFYDDDGLFHTWPADHVETDPEQVAILIERGAPLKA